MPRTTRDPKVRFNVYLSEGHYQALDRLAMSTSLTMAEILRRALDQYIEREIRAGRLSEVPAA